MSVQKYNEARKKALKILSFGLIFLLFLPVGIPVSLIITPFLAGRIGAKELPKNWHLTYIITVGGGWAIGLAASIFVLLSLALGPALRINTAEPIIFGIMIMLNWISFIIGVNSSKGSIQDVEIYDSEWDEEEKSELATTIEEEKTISASEKLKNLFTKSNEKELSKEKNGNKNYSKPLEKNMKKTKKGKERRVAALANRRRK